MAFEELELELACWSFWRWRSASLSPMSSNSATVKWAAMSSSGSQIAAAAESEYLAACVASSNKRSGFGLVEADDAPRATRAAGGAAAVTGVGDDVGDGDDDGGGDDLAEYARLP